MEGGSASDRLVEELVVEARRLGLDALGIADPTPSHHMDHYREWIDEGLHGDMAYMARHDSVARRAELRLTFEDVRSVVVVAHAYPPAEAGTAQHDPARAVIARYARGDDYHDVLKKKLLRLLARLEEVDPSVTGRAYVDTGPILERDLARRAGLGWFGRNTMLIHPKRGSYFFIGLLLLDVALPPTASFDEDRCGTCSACLDACPTGALLGRDERGAPRMDARRCISYLTIELRTAIPRELRPGVGNRVFGCDICQEVCPWNERFAAPGSEPAYAARPELDGPGLVELAERLLPMDDDAFRAAFRKSPLERPKRAGLLRNVCVALGNWGSPEAIPTLARALQDRDPLVRAHAVWALGTIGTSEALLAVRRIAGAESDPLVVEEIACVPGGPPPR